MVEHNEPWQVFAENGQPVSGASASREEFAANKTLIKAASHIWLWRRNRGEIEILVQKRSTLKKTWPGYVDVSVAGHIDANETATEAAVREASEEVGVVLDPAQLYYIFNVRTPLDPQEIDHVYLYELVDDVEFRMEDGEVESLEWKSVKDFENMTARPDSYNLVPQGNAYFSLLLHYLKQYQ